MRMIEMKSRQKKEAVYRLEYLSKYGMNPEVLKGFKNTGKLYYFENTNVINRDLQKVTVSRVKVISYITENTLPKQTLSVVKEIESNLNGLVYLGLRESKLSEYDRLYLFYIPDDKNNWEKEYYNFITTGRVNAYIIETIDGLSVSYPINLCIENTLDTIQIKEVSDE